MIKRSLFFACLSMLAIQARAAMIFSDRTQFENQLGTSITDDFSAPAYAVGNYDDTTMSSVLGETGYETTGFGNLNMIRDNGGSQHYCSGCNGSFLLDFTTTSVGTGSGVFGVGLDIYAAQNVYGTTAFVTFGDNSTANLAIPDANATTGNLFRGIIDSLLIASIHFGLVDGGSNTDNSIQRMAMDNLTIGSAGSVSAVPVPAAVWLFATALAGFLGYGRRKASQSA